jgi:putative Mg2+ transporter-C (MgtC) family protein
MEVLQAIGYVETATAQPIILLRLLIAAILGGAIGYERESHGSAGLRTHILIATAACLFTLLAFEIYHLSDVMSTGQADPIRSIEAVTAGIAFLGAGAIFQSRGNVKGMTTAAGMWLAGALGVAVALGYYGIAIAVAGLALLVLAVLKALGRHAVEERADSGE